MAAPHYAHVVLGGRRPVFPEPPTRLLTGAWKLWYIPDDDSAAGTSRTLLWIRRSGGGTGLVLQIEEDTGCFVRLYDHDSLLVDAEITFSARQRLRFNLDAPAGTLRVSGATTGNGLYTGTPWAIAAGGGEWRIGTADSGSQPARGYVSLPYGLQTDDPLPDSHELGLLQQEAGAGLLELEGGGGGIMIEG